MKKLILIATLALTVGLLAACGSSDDSTDKSESTGSSKPEITGAWARTTTPTQKTGAIYMTIESADGDALVKASVPKSIAGRAEIHETTMDQSSQDEMADDSSGEMEEHGSEDSAGQGDDHGTNESEGSGMDSPMAGMHEVDRIEIPAGESVELEPGGFHIMLMELAAPIEPTSNIPVTLTFEKAGKIEVNAPAKDQ